MCDLLTRQDSGLRFGSSTVETERRSVSILDRGILLTSTDYHHTWLSNTLPIAPRGFYLFVWLVQTRKLKIFLILNIYTTRERCMNATRKGSFECKLRTSWRLAEVTGWFPRRFVPNWGQFANVPQTKHCPLSFSSFPFLCQQYSIPKKVYFTF